MKMIFVFIDGIGIGDKDKAKNPIYAANAPTLRRLFEEIPYATVDVKMGIGGLPQSATGQTAIFTGVNASKALGVHQSGQPTVTLRNIINTNNLFKELISRGFKPTNSNVYRDAYINNMLTLKDRRLAPSVTTVMCLAEKLPFRGVEDFKNGNGIYHDLTGNIIKESGYDVEPITPEETAERLVKICKDFDFTLYEHFMTDIIGHKADIDEGIRHIELLDKFLARLLELLEVSDTTLFITSDHGNIEDCSVKTHTMNDVPAWIISSDENHKKIMGRIKEITDITPAILEFIGNEVLA